LRAEENTRLDALKAQVESSDELELGERDKRLQTIERLREVLMAD